jgi:hypothetical protein
VISFLPCCRMSMESDTTVSHGVTQPNSESKPELTFEPYGKNRHRPWDPWDHYAWVLQRSRELFQPKNMYLCYEGQNACIMQTRRNDHQWWLVVFNLSESSNCLSLSLYFLVVFMIGMDGDTDTISSKTSCK